MKIDRTIIPLAIAAIFFAASLSYAQSDRNFVSAHGIDSATCGPITDPCHTFNVAIPKTNSGGEIIALDSGVYDTFNIVVSVSMTLTAAPGVHAELSNANSGDRITINAPTTDTVVLRNLYISKQSGGGASTGIKVTSVGGLHVENCVINGFTNGISFNLNNAAQAFISDTVVRNNIGDGIVFFTSTGTLRASIDHCRFEHNGIAGTTIANGLNVLQASKVTVRDSVAVDNTGAGFVVNAGDLTLQDCESSNNVDGVTAFNSGAAVGRAFVSSSVVTNNTGNGFRQLGTGVLNSLGNNVVRRNGTNTTGTITVITGT